MTEEEYDSIEEGDIVRSKRDGKAYIIVYSLGHGKFLAERTVQVTSPREWDLAVSKARLRKEVGAPE